MRFAFERVHTVTDYYDGPIEGVADYRGAPHLYVAEFDDKAGDYSSVFRLTPISPAAFGFLMEGWKIWRRWEAAVHAGAAPQESHPALPEDRLRHEELGRLAADELARPVGPTFRARGTFEVDPQSPALGASLRALVVKWEPV